MSLAPRTLDCEILQVGLATFRVFGTDGLPLARLTLDLDGPPGVTARHLGSGLVGLSGDPDTAFPPAPAPLDATLTVGEVGYRSETLAISVAQNAILPENLPDMVLRRQPGVLQGRVVRESDGTPITGATISVVPVPPVAGEHLIELATPLPWDVPAGTQIDGFGLAAVAGPVPVKTLRATANAGDRALLLDDRQSLAAGQYLRLGAGRSRSLAEIAAVSPVPADLTQPGLVFLVGPLPASAPQGAPAAPMTLGGLVQGGQSIGTARSGEALLLADQPVQGMLLRIGPAADDRVMAPLDPTDADGRYTIPGLARFPFLEVTASAAGFTDQTRTLTQTSSLRMQLDFRLAP